MSKTRKDERGMVSILVTMIMIIVITLIVLGFAQVTRRNERESLDDQLSTQAYYAAESGVNAAVNYLTKPANIGDQINTVGNCKNFINGYLGGPSVSTLNQPSNTQYSCLMVNTEPTTLTVSPLTQNSNTILYLQNTDNPPNGEPFTSLRFQWAQQASSTFPSPPNTCSGSGVTGKTLPALNAWDCPYGILRLDLVDATNLSTPSASLEQTLENDQDVMSFYLVPSYRSGSPFVTASTVSWPPAAQPVAPGSPANPACNSGGDNCPVQIIPVSCTAGGGCAIQLNISGGVAKYFARLSMMYQDSSSVIIAGGDATHPYVPATGAGVEFTGGQALIDSTGQSQDELRRIQVRIPLNALNSTLPVNGLQTTNSICKELTNGPGVPYQDACPGHP